MIVDHTKKIQIIYTTPKMLTGEQEKRDYVRETECERVTESES